MSQPGVSRHHADWLSLVEVSGPFISMPVLMRVFPQGLEPRDPAQAKALRAAYEGWQDNPTAPGKQRSWVMSVLTAVLGYAPEQIAEGQTLPAGMEAKMPEMGETLRPDIALVGMRGSDTAGQAQLLIASYSAEQALDKPVIGKHWKATPATRMMELLHGTGVALGLVSNGEHWMLVYAPRGETTGYASWYAALWLDEPITLRAFHSLLGVRRFFGVASDSTLLALLKESASDQQEVTDQLGYQVREAVELLVKSIDTLDRENHRVLLKDVPETVLYDAALTIMMRLVFLFAAEERGLLHLGKPLYDDNYAVSTLQEQLQEIADQHGEEVLERRFDAWTRLLATFRAVHGGIQHQDLLMLAYGGSLFDPDRYPFLEGRVALSSWKASTAEPVAVNNRVVLHLLNSLQRLQIRVPGGGPAESRRISFRALGVEQIGHVYEGLLDRTAVRASEPILGLKGARDKEQEVSLTSLESYFAQGPDKLIEFLKDETGRSSSALKRELEEGKVLDEHRLLIACGHDKKLLERVQPFVNLIRNSSFGHPLVTLTNSIYVTTTTTRRSTGTHYTPPWLTEPIVQHTLEPLVYEGPAKGVPREQWELKYPKAILDLKLCDMAMGSGAFLVQACRYLAERLVESWEILEKQHQGEVLITPGATFSTGLPDERLVPADVHERIAIARRMVADRCLYGVDINPMAVEMAKLSLWLVTLQRDRPFSFLDHALKCGDSLLGISSVHQISNFSLRPGERQITFATADLSRCLEEASAKRRALEELPSNDQMQIETKNRLHAEAEASTARVKALADCLIALELCGLDGKAYDEKRALMADRTEAAMQKPLKDFRKFANEQLRQHRTFHWPVEFPEVFSGGGFDAFVGNPPFMGGQKISGSFGNDYREYLVSEIAKGTRSSADLCGYFFLRAHTLVVPERGGAGLIATNTIAEGVTREACLDRITNDATIYRAQSDIPWPGAAALTVSCVWFRRGLFGGRITLNDAVVTGIDSSLRPTEHSIAAARLLQSNASLCFQGVIPLGEGFLLSRSEAENFFSLGADYRDVVRPYITGKILNSQANTAPKAWIINFFDWPLDQQSAPPNYRGPFAEDYPEVLQRVERLVKPERDHNPRKSRREKWWHFAEKASGLQHEIERRALKKVLAIVMTAVHFKFEWVASDFVFDQTIVPILLDEEWAFAVLQSSQHLEWAYYCGSSFGAGAAPRYNPTRCFETFAFPSDKPQQLHSIARKYVCSRDQIMSSRGEGLTKIYNHFHDRNDVSEDITELRALQVEMDQAVAAAYGWCNLDLDHGFYETKQGIRYTISESARRAVLDHLLALNHQRHAEEAAEQAAQALTAPVKRGRKKKDRADNLTLDLL